MPDFLKRKQEVASVKFNLNVGTSASFEDVIAADVLQPAYNESSAELKSIPAGVKRSSFFLSCRDCDAAGSRLMVQRPAVLVEGKGLGAQLVLHGKWDKYLTPVPSVKNSKQTRVFTITYKCGEATTKKVMVRLRAVLQGAKGEKGKNKQAKEFAFTFEKECGKAAAPAVSSVGLVGFSVGTREGLSDIIDDGVTQKAYKANAKDALTKLDATTNQLQAFAMGPTNMVLKRSAIVADKRVATAHVYGYLNFTASAEGAKSQKRMLNIKFVCKKKGSTVVRLFFKEINGDGHASFAIRKQCNGRAGKRTDAGKGTPARISGILLPGLQIAAGSSQVVTGGRVHTDYELSGSRKEDLASERPSIPVDVDELTFTVTLTKPLHEKVRRPWVSAHPFTGTHPIVHPQLSLDREAWGKLKTTKSANFTILFGCFGKGVSNVVVSLGVEGEGTLEFVLRKVCDAEPSYEDLDTVTEVEGLVIGTTLMGSDVAENGVIKPQFDWGKRSDTIKDLHTLSSDDPFVTFYLRSDTEIDPMPLAFDKPKLLSGEELAETEFSGPGADGGFIDAEHPGTAVSVTFHCLAQGSAIYTLILPMTTYVKPPADNNDYGTYDNPYDYGEGEGYGSYDYGEYGDLGRRLTAEGDWEDDDAGSSKKQGKKIALEDKAIRITFIKNCSTFSLSRPKTGLGGVYLPGFSICTTKSCDEGSEVVKNGFPLSEYFGQKTLPASQRSWNVLPNTTLSSRFFFHYTPDAPSVDAFGDVPFLPNLNLLFKNAELRIDSPMLVKNGLYADPALSNVASRGLTLKAGRTRELDLTWNCKFEGTAVATVVLPVRPTGSVTFTLAKRCSGKTPTRGLEVGGLMVGTGPGKSDVIKEGLTQPSFNQFLASETSDFTEYDDKTVFYIRGPKGDDALPALEPMVFAHRPVANVDLDHTMHLGDKESEKEQDDKEKKEEEAAEAVEVIIDEHEKKLTVSYNCIFPGSTAVTLVLPMLPKGKVVFHWTKVCGQEEKGDLYEGYMDDYAEEYGYGDAYGGADYGGLADWDERHSNPDLYDTYGYDEEEDAGQDSLGYIDVASSKEESSDVVAMGSASDRYSMPSGSKNMMQTIIKADQKEMSFWLSVPAGGQSFDAPTVLALKSSSGKTILKPRLKGAASVGGRVVGGGEKVKLTVQFNCASTGVTPVLVALPLIPYNLGSVSFRVVKVCGHFEKKTDSAWTVGNMLAALVGGSVLLTGAICFFVKRQSTSGPAYAKVSNNADIAMDTFDTELGDEGSLSDD